jgi:hypothetical protein
MRRILSSLLLASAVATPALAGPDGPRWDAARADKQETRAERQQERSERQQARSEHQQAPSERAAAPAQSAGREVRSFGAGARHDFNVGASSPGNSSDSVRGWRGGRADQGSMAETPSPTRQQQIDQEAPHRPTNWQAHERRIGDSSTLGRRHERSDDVADQQPPSNGQRSIQWRRAPGATSGGLVQPDRPLPRVFRTRTPVISETPREGTQPPPRTDLSRRTAAVHWNTDWRHDNRYDWTSWRRSHRSHFHLGFYYDPFGWGYRPYLVGWRLWPAYYSSRFWITDPWYYRLPYAPPGYRWIRYYDDLILVDTWDGRVVDVIYDFFW